MECKATGFIYIGSSYHKQGHILNVNCILFEANSAVFKASGLERWGRRANPFLNEHISSQMNSCANKSWRVLQLIHRGYDIYTAFTRQLIGVEGYNY